MNEPMPRHSRPDERQENLDQAAGAEPPTVGLGHRTGGATGHAGHGSGHDRHADALRWRNCAGFRTNCAGASAKEAKSLGKSNAKGGT
jgi:hypothetical protein